jgi:DNA repair exonuclease SbcCD nuclease subunit
MKVAIITDQHFGFKKGSKLYHDYFLKFYEETFFPTLEREGITTILDLGDTFDNRKGIDSYSLDWAKKHYFDPIRNMGISLVSIVGNHTAFYKNTNEINTIDLLLREYDNVTIVSECQELKVGNLDVLFIPWINIENEIETYKKVKETKCKVAMGHLELNGFVATHGHLMEHGADFEIYNKFKQVFSGHYHTRSNNGTIYYLGNPYEMFWNDVNDKRGFHIYDTETLKLKTINNPFQLYKVINYHDTPRQLTNFAEYTGKIVKVVVRQKSDEKEYNRFMKALDKARPVDVKIVERTDHLAIADEVIDQTEDTMTLLTKYIDDLDTDLDRVRIKKVISEIYTEALECI